MSIPSSSSESISLDPSQCKDIANTIRFLSIEAIEKAKSGHPGAPMGLAEISAQLWNDLYRFDPKDPQWKGRDRFVLSCGHASMLLYSLLHLWGIELTQSDLKNFRQWGSLTPGHPEVGHTAGVEMTTGPLGQGVATSVGLALGQAVLSAKIKELGGGAHHPWSQQKTITLCSDGDLMEGISYEAASLAGHWQLGQLVWFYDDNGITIDGQTSLAFSENVHLRFESMGWRVFQVDGHDPQALAEMMKTIQAPSSQPTLVVCKTHIGYGSPNKVDSSSSHGAPLGRDEIGLTREALGWNTEPFEVPSSVSQWMQQAQDQKHQQRQKWDEEYTLWTQSHPEAAQFAESFWTHSIDVEQMIHTLSEGISSGGATRKLSNAVLEKAYDLFPQLLGGSADLSGSNGLAFKAMSAFGPSERHPSMVPHGRKLHFGIREHAMGAITNGLALYGPFQAFCGTFLVFSDYVRPAIRLASLSRIASHYIFTHDSIFLGEDGPTHQPIEHAWALRLIPDVTDFRPADGLEVALSWAWMMTQAQTPSTIMLTRQTLPALDREDGFDSKSIWQGGYILHHEKEDSPLSVTLVATGSEVSLAVDASKLLAQKGINTRVVSMPSVNLFLRQSKQVQEHIIPSHSPVVSIEAGSTGPWSQITGRGGLNIGIDRFGSSAPMADLAKYFGFTPAQVSQRIEDFLNA